MTAQPERVSDERLETCRASYENLRMPELYSIFVELQERRRAETAPAAVERCTNCGQSFAASRHFRITGRLP